MFPITIAAFLSDVCPEVEAVKSEWHHGILWTEVDLDEVDTYRERWEEVENLLPAFSAVRKQCMEWAQKKAKEESVVPAQEDLGMWALVSRRVSKAVAVQKLALAAETKETVIPHRN
ncbi:hypothetical protein JVT61DRAFT_15164 [Boletus reticuloceps]|uniref:Uncharacterized protein n=1 Tax=Boletus reticuloceps TaxID=495285 RepID=A0A8I2YUU1_9AGAM|nr:hypothetical protein JVT61DRAFT_15164 [Boletus reticuloceps]